MAGLVVSARAPPCGLDWRLDWLARPAAQSRRAAARGALYWRRHRNSRNTRLRDGDGRPHQPRAAIHAVGISDRSSDRVELDSIAKSLCPRRCGFHPLAASDPDAARGAVARIVGRDLSSLDDAGLTRASLESLAENASDGVVAPIFWGAIFGLPGIAFYKAVNTLDSMIGHRDARYRAFGGFAARLDDMLNLAPARLTGVLIAAASAHPRAWTILFRDAGKHRSMNAGWPEAAMAGALDVRLSGPRLYGAETHLEPWLHPDGRDAGTEDLAHGLRLYLRALAIAGVLLVAIAGGLAYAT